MRRLDLLIALGIFLADVEQPDRRIIFAEDVLDVNRRHHSALHKMFGLAVDVCAAVEHQRHSARSRDRSGDRRSTDPLNPTEDQLSRRRRRPRISRRQHRVALAALDELRRHHDRRIFFGSDRFRRVLAHLDHIGRVFDRNFFRWLIEKFFDPILIADQNYFARKFLRRLERALDDLLRRVIASHCVDCNLQLISLLTQKMSRSKPLPAQKNFRLILCSLDNFTSIIITALEAHVMRKFRLAASGAFDVLRSLKFPIGATTIAA